MSARTRRIVTRFMAVQYRIYNRLRPRSAFEAATRPGTATDFGSFRGHRQCLLVTFKRSGEPVPVPVNFGLLDDHTLYIRTEPRSAKVKRLANDPHVRVCPCNFRGKPLRPMVDATARALPESACTQAHEVIAQNWDLPSRFLERSLDRFGLEVVYLEVTCRPSA